MAADVPEKAKLSLVISAPVVTTVVGAIAAPPLNKSKVVLADIDTVGAIRLGVILNTPE